MMGIIGLLRVPAGFSALSMSSTTENQEVPSVDCNLFGSTGGFGHIGQIKPGRPVYPSEGSRPYAIRVCGNCRTDRTDEMLLY